MNIDKNEYTGFQYRSGYKPSSQELKGLKPLTPNSDEDENSLYIITTCLNNQVRRIKEAITKDKMS